MEETCDCSQHSSAPAERDLKEHNARTASAGRGLITPTRKGSSGDANSRIDYPCDTVACTALLQGVLLDPLSALAAPSSKSGVLFQDLEPAACDRVSAHAR
jgi:hypothetical protein